MRKFFVGFIILAGISLLVKMYFIDCPRIIKHKIQFNMEMWKRYQENSKYNQTLIKTIQSTNANLSSITISSGELKYLGSNSTLKYYLARVPNNTNNIVITAISEDRCANIAIVSDRWKWSQGINHVNLALNLNFFQNKSVKITVTAPNSKNYKYYLIKIIREEATSPN